MLNFDWYKSCSQRKISQFFSYFPAKFCAQKPKKAQTNRANITGVQYFLQYFCAYQQAVSTSSLSFILYSFHLITICANFPCILVPLVDILMPSPQSWSRLRICSSGWDTADADTVFNTPGWGRFICRTLIGGRRSLCLEPTVAVTTGVGNRHKFLIPTYYPFLSTPQPSFPHPLLITAPRYIPPSVSLHDPPSILPKACIVPYPLPTHYQITCHHSAAQSDRVEYPSGGKQPSSWNMIYSG